MACAVRSALACILIAALAAERVSAQLPKTTAKNLERGVALLREGKHEEVHKALAPLLEAKPADVQAADNYVKDQGAGESLLDLVVAMRVQLAEQSGANKLRRPDKTELAASLVALSDRLISIRQPIDAELAQAVRVAAPVELIEQRIRSLAAGAGQIERAANVLEHLSNLSKRLKPAETAKLDEAAKEAAKTDFKEAQAELAKLEDRVVEKLIELNLTRIASSLGILEDRSKGFKQRFDAATRVSASLASLTENWPRFKRCKERSAGLDNIGLVQKQWTESEQRFREVSADLVEKAFHFEEAKRWWLRARFGQGPLDGGMAKAIPGGRTRNQQQSLLFYPVQMPNPIPRPPDPLKNPLNVPVPRRHMAFWLSASALESNVARGYAPDPIDPTLPQALFNKQELQALMNGLDFDVDGSRLVGFLEYQMSLLHFERLLQMTTAEEQKGLDEMIAEDDRFVIHSYLSRQYNPLAPESTIQRKIPKSEDPRAKGEYERRGLAWVLALARIELGAMTAARIPRLLIGPEYYRESVSFTQGQVIGTGDGQVQVNLGSGRSLAAGGRTQVEVEAGRERYRVTSFRTFSAWPPTPLEYETFDELLWDGARQQYYSLRSEVFVSSPARNVLALEQFLVRVSVALEMCQALADYKGQPLTGEQRAELASWINWLGTVQAAILATLYPLERVVRTVAPGGSIDQTVQDARQQLRRTIDRRDLNSLNRPLPPR